MALRDDLNHLRPMFVSAIKQLFGKWQAAGNFPPNRSHDISQTIIDIIRNNLDNIYATRKSLPNGQDEWIIALDDKDAFIINIPPYVYEQYKDDGEHVMLKNKIKVTSNDIVITPIKHEMINEVFNINFNSDINYADDQFSNMSSDGMTDDLWQLAKDDAQKFSKLNIKTDKQRNLLLYLENFFDDVCKDLNHKTDNKEECICKAYDYLKNRKKVELNDIYEAINKYICQCKVAYPNTMGVRFSDAKAEHDVNKWINTLSSIYAAVGHGEGQQSAKERLTEDWDLMEKLDFDSWLRYYEHGDHEKYKTADLHNPVLEDNFQSEPEQFEEINGLMVKRPGRPKNKDRTPQDMKHALIGRLDSADKLLREFVNVWPQDVWNRLHQALNDVKREIVMLKSTASMQDVIIRTANMWNNYGFPEGAELLYKIAQPPSGGVASEIESALTGNIKEKEAPADLGTPSGGLNLDLGATTPPSGADIGAGAPAPVEKMDAPPAEEPAAPPAAAAEPLPAPAELPITEKPKKEELKKEETTVEVEENPYGGTTVTDILKVLEPVQKMINSRDMVRELSKADMMMDAQHIASHFPELGEVMAKALEANTYISTRLDKIVGRLSGSEEPKKEEKKESAPEIEMGELKSAPAGTEPVAAPETPPAPVAKPEETKLEVTEEAPKV